MSDRMKDRVANAIAEYRYLGEPIFIAHKVLEAMRTPTHEMFEASGYGDMELFGADWSRMIDAALSARAVSEQDNE